MKSTDQLQKNPRVTEIHDKASTWPDYAGLSAHIVSVSTGPVIGESRVPKSL